MHINKVLMAAVIDMLLENLKKKNLKLTNHSKPLALVNIQRLKFSIILIILNDMFIMKINNKSSS